MIPYEHKVQYYETDGMGIVHHSNYIRWFEEARVDLLEQLGFGYNRIEEAGYSASVMHTMARIFSWFLVSSFTRVRHLYVSIIARRV